MIALLQRVTRASVTVDDEVVAAIGRGLLVLVGVERGDGEAQASRLAERLLAYRVFADSEGRMNLSVADVGGALLLVPQFTLAADTDKGNRPSFSSAADPVTGERLFAFLAERVRASGLRCELGRFGAHMAVELVNDGPVTFQLRVPPPER
ncbi:MAG TPA: D-aminoacyl-tRNA deacylase [Gammaproteobacteria bacterium]